MPLGARLPAPPVDAGAPSCSASPALGSSADMATIAIESDTPVEAPQPKLTPEERAERGKAARADAPRSSHAEWSPPSDRPDPIALLEEQAATRVPELLPIRYGRMAATPFAFYRGGAYIMASDLAPTPTTGLRVQLCGDAHLSNFGGF